MTRIGPYRLIEVIGEGGLGVVWRAEQTEPVQREVAIKLIRPELGYRAEAIARFDLERQALARMNHPNIAAMLDAGTLPDERPYFVMELVRGEPLTTYCKRSGMDVRARLQIFVTICQAVHHAHQKGILHRDLKPSNILVQERDGVPAPKVIDFGIAKALDQTDQVLNPLFFRTQPGGVPCATYQYMSPEQASRGGADIDTRSDIYTLGVILYELLTGKLPLPDELARSNNFDAIASHVREIDATRPSQRVTETGATSPALRGDLDWIVLRALEKNPERRYQSAAALADDVQRHLTHEPVAAGPPGALYRCGKWVRRHRAAFASIAAIALSLIAGLVSTLLALARERDALARESAERSHAEASRALAEKRHAEAESARKDEVAARARAEAARQAAEESRQVADSARGRAEKLINDMLFGLRDALEPVGKVALLDQVSQSAERYFQEVPAGDDNDVQQRNRAAMLQNRGSILLAKGDAGKARACFDQSMQIIRARAAEQPANVQRLHDLALAHERTGSAREALGDDEAAAASYQEMLRSLDHLAASAPKDAPGRWRLDHAVAHERLGDLARKHGKAEEAMASYQSGMEILRALPKSGDASKRMAVLEGKLGTVDAAHAREHFERALVTWTLLSVASPDDAALLAMKAVAHGQMAMASSGEDALTHAQAQADAYAHLTTMDPLNVTWRRAHATAWHQLGVALEAAGRLDQALAAFRRDVELTSTLADARRDSAVAHLRLAALLFRMNLEKDAGEHAQHTLRLLANDSDDEARAWRSTALELAKLPQ